MRYILTYCFIVITLFSFSQEQIPNNSITSETLNDSLENLIKESKSYIDRNPAKARILAYKILEIASKTEAVEKQATAYLIIGISYQKEQRYPEALMYYNKALKIGEKNKFPGIMAQANGSIGVVFEKTAEYNKAISYYHNAKKIFTEQKDSSGIVKCYINIGKALSIMGKNPEAISNLMDGLKIADKTGDKYLQSRVHNNISVIYQSLGKNQEALESFLKCAKLSNDVHDSLGLADSYNNVGITYQALENQEKALEYFNFSLELRKKINDKYGLAMSYNNIGSVYFKLTKFQNALEYFVKAYDISTELNDKFGQAKYLKNISDVYMKEKKYENAVTILEKSKLIANEIDAKDELLSAQYALADAYAKLNSYDKAYYALSQYFNLLDSVMNERNTRIIEDLKIKYETNKKEQDLILKEQKIQILTKEASLHSFRIILLIFIVLAIVVLAAVIYFWQKKIMLKNQQIAVSEKKFIEIRLQNSLLEQEKLNREIEDKNKEIMSLALQIISKNEFLENIKEEIKSTSKGLKGEENISVFNKMVTQINRNLSLDRDRNEFQSKVDSANKAFFDKLLSINSGITENEKRLSALLRLNLTSKDIAAITNISPSSVDVSRYRLRKKLNLETDDNLCQFLNNL